MEPFFLRHRPRLVCLLSRALPVICLLFLGMVVPAEGQDETSSAPIMDTVVVVGTVASDAIGKSTFDQNQISLLPTGDGNIEDLLKLLPGVQLSDTANTSFRGGEISPPLISISGGRPYENNFLIDGMGNNSLLDPLEDNVNSINTIPGHPNEIFLHTNLIKSIAVYDNNIPARYGGFTGGVIDVETIEPGPELYATLNYKMTRSSWGEFHIDANDYDDFVNSDTPYQQPRFEKRDTGLLLNVPVTDHVGVLLSYNRLYSKIPLKFINRTLDQYRISDNVLFKAVYRPVVDSKISFQFIHSPYTGKYFTKETEDSEFKLEGGGNSLKVGYEKTFYSGTLTLDAGYRESENSRSAPKDFYRWANSPSKSWGVLLSSNYSKEGGFGSIETAQKTFESNIDWISNQIETKAGSHLLNFGLNWSVVEGTYDRPVDTYSFNTSVPVQVAPPALVADPSILCVAGDLACINAELYLRRRIVYSKGYAEAEIESIALYADDSWNLGRFKFRPGIRFSYDDLTKNSNLAPRLNGSINLTGNGNTVFVGGWNRYYGQTLLTYKLREGIAPTKFEQRTDNVSPWIEYNELTSLTQYSHLETPYSDEMVVGIKQKLWGSEVDIRYVYRENKDQFAQERDPLGTSPYRYYRLNNNGSSAYESVRLQWEKYWEKHVLSLNATYQETTTSNEGYDDNFDAADFDPDVRIWFDGKLLWQDELPREDFNRPVVASLIYSALLPGDVTFTNVTNYRSGYRGIVDSGNTININGVDHDIYQEISLPSATIFDWKVDWVPHFISEKACTLTLEVMNVFNKKAHVSAKSDEYELGRQYWVGAEYRF